MIERVAEVLSQKESGLNLAELARHSQPRDADFFRDCARAAIEAMREPTPEMMRAFQNGHELGAWHEAIAAALSTSKRGDET